MIRNKIDWKKMDAILSVKEADENYLFHDQIKQIKDRCHDIIGVKRADETHSANISEDFTDGQSIGIRRESIVGIVGERGSGKSSLLHTACEALRSDNFYLLDVLDPNVFDDSMSILELFVSQIYRKLQETEENNFDADDYESMDLHRRLKEIIKLLSDYQSGKENFYQTHTYSDLLENIMHRVNMPTLIHDLVKNFLEFARRSRKNHAAYAGLVLCIDDVDLVSNDKVYSLLEDIRKYLAGNIIVITAFRSSQLFDAVLNEKLGENEELIGQDSVTIDDIRDQVARYLEKLIPVHNRIQLLDADDLLGKTYYKIFYGLMEQRISSDEELKKTLDNVLEEKGLSGLNQDLSMREWLYHLLNLRIRLKLKPIDRWENTVYNLPVNLRGLLQLAYLIIERMQKVDLKETSEPLLDLKSRSERCGVILSNLAEYKKYFLQGIQEILPVELRGVIDLWLRSDYHAKNYLLCDELLKRIATIDESVLAKMPRYNLFQIHNICIGDVYHVLETYKSVCGMEDKSRYFVYSLKVLYSIELLAHYLIAAMKYPNDLSKSSDVSSSTYDPDLGIYLTLINAKIISNSFGYFTRKPWEGAVVYTKSNDPSIVKIYQHLLYSAVAAEGDLRRSAPVYEYVDDVIKRESRTSLQIATYDTFKYRRLYEYDWTILQADLQNGTQYPIDPFAFLGQRQFVETTFFSNQYVFFNLFDLDVIVRINYGRSGESSKSDDRTSEHIRLQRLLCYVDCIVLAQKALDDVTLDPYELELVQGMADAIFYTEKNRTSRAHIFTDKGGVVENLEKLLLNKGDVYRLSKRAFTLLIEKLLNASDIHLSKEESAALKRVSSKLTTSKTAVKKTERDLVNSIVEGHDNYIVDVEALEKEALIKATIAEPLVYRLSKEKFLHLIKRLQNEERLEDKEKASLNAIYDRLQKPRIQMRTDEKDVVNKIVNRINYELNEETL